MQNSKSSLIMDPALTKLLRGLTPTQQHQFACLAPEARSTFLVELQRRRNNALFPNAHAPVQADPQHQPQIASLNVPEPPKRKRGGGPRKCNNPACDRIVTKRNFCFKCQKRKERGLPLGPRLPSVTQILTEDPKSLPSFQTFSQDSTPTPQSPYYASPQSMVEQPANVTVVPEKKTVEKQAKMAQLRSYLLSLAGSEEEATELVKDYLHRSPLPNQPRPEVVQTQIPTGYIYQPQQIPNPTSFQSMLSAPPTQFSQYHYY